jgi:hypothetical protein
MKRKERTKISVNNEEAVAVRKGKKKPVFFFSLTFISFDSSEQLSLCLLTHSYTMKFLFFNSDMERRNAVSTFTVINYRSIFAEKREEVIELIKLCNNDNYIRIKLIKFAQFSVKFANLSNL